ncbi:hypothetical protein ACP4OV_022712 [Aristida adscensionis]
MKETPVDFSSVFFPLRSCLVGLLFASPSSPAMAFTPPSSPPSYDYLPDGNYDYYDAVRELALKLGVGDPASVFDKEREMPACLAAAEEHALVPQQDDATGATSHWVKAWSAEQLQASLTSLAGDEMAELMDNPVFVYLLPSTPLDDARRILEMQASKVPHRDVRFVNGDQLSCKLAALAAAGDVIGRVKSTLEYVQGMTEEVRARVHADASVREVEETARLYGEARAAYRAAQAAGGGRADEEHCKLLAAAARHHVAREVADGLARTEAAMAAVAGRIAEKVDDLEKAMKGLTFMGCGEDEDATETDTD